MPPGFAVLLLVGEPILPVGLVGIGNAGEELRRRHEVLPGDQVSVGDSNVHHTTVSSAWNNTKLSSSRRAPATQADLIGRPGGFPLAVEIIPGRSDGAVCCFKTQAN